ncbi:TrkA C-terminal domain-containing protein [uncultured Clostridium sp.]|uniref:TrkA C-terminal domain-containing protein n=1 Tax=uncultured Clostridium sp. TaxID=59620 RepID=UPI0025F90E84|nr:TrkA C-terminal domain-containing protein [uncultured Clostridium sp.]
MIFFMALFSVAVQGTLIPTVARKLDLIDDEESILKTFNDYKEDKSTKLVEFTISNNNPMANKSIMDANIPEDILVVMVKRKGDVFVPHGSTVILPGDTLVLSGNNLMNFSDYKEGKSTNLMEIYVNDKSNIVNKSIKDSNIAYDILIVMIKRKDKVIIPNGNTVIMPEDILVVTANDLKNVENIVIA